MIDAIILNHQNARVPRYTSYPTAPHFTHQIDDGRYRRLLETVEPVPLSVYVHVPYCRTLCWYCGCHTRASRTDAPILRYADALRREIALLAETLPGRLPLGHVHWGGGTPTILPPETFRAVMADLDAAFDRRPDAEIAVEIDPRVIDADRIAVFRDVGVTRVSVGVQSFDPRVQAAINRQQSVEETARCIDGLRAVGIGGLNLDLVYGLPHQTVDNAVATVEACLAFAPDRFAVFGYAHLPSLKRHQRLIDAVILPDGTERLAQYRAIADRIEGAGYRPIGLDHFARADDALALAAAEGTLRRNFQGYTADPCPTLIGLGASSIGAFPDAYVQNTADIPAYLAAAEDGRFATARSRFLTDEDRIRRAVIEALMCHLSVDLAAVAGRHGTEPAGFMADLDRLAPLAREGIVSVDGWQITVPEPFRPLIRSVAAAFDVYLNPTEQRHAVAV